MSNLQHLLAERAQLQAEAEPLRERLQRCDAALQALNEAAAWRDRLLDPPEHGPSKEQVEYGNRQLLVMMTAFWRYLAGGSI